MVGGLYQSTASLHSSQVSVSASGVRLTCDLPASSSSLLLPHLPAPSALLKQTLASVLWVGGLWSLRCIPVTGTHMTEATRCLLSL